MCVLATKIHLLSPYPPQFSPEVEWWDIKLDHKPQPPEEGLVDVLEEVGGEDDDAREPLNVVEQDTHVHIGISVCGGAVCEE